VAVRVVRSVSVTDAYASGGSIAHELSPLPYTVTRIDWRIESNLTTSASPGTSQDYIWRLISSLSLSSPLGNHLTLGDLRPLHFENRFRWGGHTFATPAAPGASATGVTKNVHLRLDMGVNPLDPWDLTGGIPAHVGNFSLAGTWAAATQVGSGYTVNAGTLLRTKMYGVLPEQDGEAIPRAIPVIQTYQPQPSANSASLGTTWNFPKGHYLHSLTIMPAAGVRPADNRSDTALQDIGIGIPVAGNRQPFYDTWPSFRQQERYIAVAEDDGTTFGVPTVAPEGDPGVAYLPIHRLAAGGHPLYGVDNRQAGEGDTQLLFGVVSSTNLSVWLLTRHYDLNPAAGGT
jgi:hypothetical protein